MNVCIYIYIDVWMLLLCGANPNLSTKAAEDTSPLDLIIAKINENCNENDLYETNEIPCWDCLLQYAKYYKYRNTSYGYNHPYDICGYFYYYYQRMIIGYTCCCYPMEYDITLMTNIKCAELLIRYGAIVLIDCHYYPLNKINHEKIRLHLINLVDTVNSKRNPIHIHNIQSAVEIDDIYVKNPTNPTNIIISDIEVMKNK